MGEEKGGHNPPGTDAWMLVDDYVTFQTLSLCLSLPGML